MTDILADRLANALVMAPQAASIVVAGGVAANLAIRARLTAIAMASNKPFIAPPLRLCTDNAVMVAWAGVERLRAGLSDDLSAPCRPRWPLAAA